MGINSTYTRINLVDENVELSWPFPQTGIEIVCDTTNVYADIAGLGIYLPAGNLVSTGASFVLNIIGPNAVFVYDALGDSLFVDDDYEPVPLDSGKVIELCLIGNDTKRGTWQSIPYGGGEVAINTLTVTSTNESVILNTNKSTATIAPPGGTIDLAIPDNLFSIITDIGPESGSESGFVSTVIDTVNDTLTWSTRTFTSDSNITITNPTGATNNPQFSLNTNGLSGLASIVLGGDGTTGGIKISANTILDADAANPLAITSSKGLVLNGNVTAANNVAVTGNLAVTGNVTVSGTLTQAAIAKGWCFFTDAITGDEVSNISIMQKSGIVSSVTGSNGVYTVTFSTASGDVLADSNYAVFLNLRRSNTSSIVPFQAFVSAATTSHCIVYAIDTLGNILPAIEGMSVMIMYNPS